MRVILRPRAITLLLGLLTISASGQQIGRNKSFTLQTSTITHFKDLNEKTVTVSNEIRQKHPEIPQAVLTQDGTLIKMALPRIRTEFWKVGLTEEDAVTSMLDSWKVVRLQSPLRLQPETPMDESSFLDYVILNGRTKTLSRMLLKENPELSVNTLRKDLILISAWQPDIAEEFKKKGWTEADAQQASLTAWLDIRTDSPLKANQSMNRVSFIENVTEERGIILFTSDPDETDVFQGQDKIGTTSKDENRLLTLVFKDKEEVTVVFSKSGWVSESRTCSAIRRELVRCSATLKSK